MSRELRVLYRGATFASLLAAAGCLADKGVAPAPNYELPSSAVLQKTVYSNSVKYSDKGHKAATQKGTYFQISAIALLDKQGVTHLAVTTGTFEDPASNIGVISKVQVRAVGPDGKTILNRNETGLTGGPRFNKDYTGLARNTKVDLTVTVRDAGGAKVDQFAVSTLVKLLPDLAVSSIDVPDEAMINTPVNIATTITERNGDLGARTDCVLVVDGIETDRAAGIWVDVGNAVSCAFTHTFTQTEEHQIKVKALNVLPIDYNYENNEASTHNHISAPPSQLQLAYNARASQDIDDVTMHTSSFYTSADGSVHSEATSLSQTLTKQQSALLYATLPKLVVFPLTKLELTQGTGGQILHNGVYENVASTSSDESSGQRQVCATADAPSATGVVSWYVCTIAPLAGSSTQPQTTVQYARYAGQVTYHSESYSLYWDNVSGESVWSDNSTSYAGDETWIPFGSTYDFTLSLTDGTTVYSAAPSITLLQVNQDLSTPEVCNPGSDEGGSWDYCEKSDHTKETLSGVREFIP
jgi:hypothetical protein